MNAVEVVIGAKTSEAIVSVVELSKKLNSLVDSAAKATKSILNFGKALAQATLGVGKYQSGLSKVVDAFKRIVFYRAIRSAIREVTQGFKEGVENVYQYSLAIGRIDASDAVGTMNQLATASLYIKNSLGAAVMPILQSLVPLVNAIADAFANAANAVNQFLQALKGNTMFTRAKRYAVDYADGLKQASGAAKELKKQTFGFDELNIFNAPSTGGGGGGNGLDYSQMFEEADVSDFMKNLKQMMNEGEWQQVGSLVAQRLNDIVANFDAAGFGSRLGKKLQNGLSVAVGFMQNFNFRQVGAKLATALNNLFYQVKFEDVGTFFAEKLTALFDFVLGFIETFNFGTLGEAIRKAVVSWFDGLADWLLSPEIDWEGFGNTFFHQVYDFVTGINLGAIFSSFFHLVGVAFASALQAVKGFFDGVYEKVSGYFHDKTDECGGNAVAGFFKGILDALVGVVAWIYEHIVAPFVDGILEGFGISNGISMTFKGFGEDIINGLLAGLKNTWVGKIVGWVNDKVKWLNQKFSITPTSKNGADFNIGVGATYYAEGGQPETGSLFWAGERGAELLTTVGGRSTVTTQDQFTQGMSNIMDNTNTVIMQMGQAVVQAILSKDMTSIVNIGDRQIVSAYDRGKRLAGASLVE